VVELERRAHLLDIAGSQRPLCAATT
jgi:hypothetical protein